MQAVRDYYHSAIDCSEFVLMIDRHSSEVGLEVPSDLMWEVVPLIMPPKVLFQMFVPSCVYVNGGSHLVLFSD